MPKGQKEKRELFTCPECGTKQPLGKNLHRSLTCIDCETSFAIVKDDDGNKVLAPYYNQSTRD